MTLRRDEWIVLEDLADHGEDGWATGTRPLGKRYRAATIVRGLAGHGLCELAPDDVLAALLAADDARPDWAARITGLGRTVLTYRALQQDPVPQPDLNPAPARIDVRGADMDILRSALASAEAGALPGVDVPALRTALAGARPVSGSLRHTMNPAEDELAAVHSVLHLESLVRDATGYHHLLRQLPSASPGGPFR
ncbi:hypothetical protein [Kitasatospora sp. NPDC059462]|uniref:hypothetical protein n=1 Tax=Kitasatospora sp. NPDC059462 TaxID=3346841 RepID=UPI0036CF683A